MEWMGAILITLVYYHFNISNYRNNSIPQLLLILLMIMMVMLW
jgi:hypothetical protein